MNKAGRFKWHRSEEESASRPVEEDGASRPVRESERERQLHGLALLSLFLHSTGSVEEMMGKLMEQAPTVTGAVFVYPLLLDRKRQLLRASALEGCIESHFEAAMEAFQEDLTALEFSLVQNDGLYRVLNDGEVALRSSLGIVMEGTLPAEQWQPAEEALGIRHLAIVPMVVESEPLGLTVFGFESDEIDVEALELLVGHLTLALRDLLVRDEVVRFSDIDPVTWVYSRRYLTQSLESEIMRAGRYGRGLSLVLLDIDDFSEFNSLYGQSIGDRMLRSVATTLAETVSPPEIVARVKDDEFAVLLPETNRAVAVTTTTRLLASLANTSVFSGEDGDVRPLTVSVAIACFPEDGTTPYALLERVQADLKSAKLERQQEARPARNPVDPIARTAMERRAAE